MTIDRAKLRVAIRKLGDEYVYFMLDEALEMLPDAKLAKLVGQYLDVKRLQGDENNKRDLFEQLAEFERANLAREFYDSFRVDSKNFMQKSNGTRAWIAECRRLLDQLVDASKKGDPVKVGTGFETIFNLLHRIDEGRDDLLFFADEGGSWQVGIDWEKVFPAWFQCLSRTASPDEYGRLVVAAIDDLDQADRRDHLEAARRPATAAQKKALAKAGTGEPAPPMTKRPR